MVKKPRGESLGQPTIEELNHIAKKINLAYSYVVGSLTTEELSQFADYVYKMEAVLPVLDPTSYIHDESKMILEAVKRLRALQAFFKALK